MKHSHATKLLLFAALGFAACSAFATSVMPRQYSTPALYGDLVLFSQFTGSKLYAIDRATKRDVWVWSCGCRSVRTTPTVAGDVAFIWAGGCKDSRACAINCRTGVSIWETPAEGYTWEEARLVEDVVIFPVTCETSEINAFDRATGRKLWVKKDADLLLVHGKDLLVSKDSDSKLVVLDPLTGAEQFSCPFSTAEYAEPQADCNDAGIAVAGCEGSVLALDIPNRKELWRVETGKKRLIPALDGDSLFLVTGRSSGNNYGSQSLELWNLANGSRESKVEFQELCASYTKPVLFDGMVIVPTPGQIFAVERETGKEIWQVSIGGSYGTCRTPDSIYVGTTGPRVVQIDAKTGKTLWSYDVDRPQDVEQGGPGCEGSESGLARFFGGRGIVLVLPGSVLVVVLVIVAMFWWKRR
ncbi:MAG: hypothetical protein FD180_2409 [Planctomycetota bacterium]|nr:MAG: hypothetical protein FD180_2409 [Planctomycetota bacterium]